MSTLPIKLSKRISGKCCYSGCGATANDGSDFCAPHDAHERGRDAGKKRRRRQRMANAGLCIVGCGRKVPKRKRLDGTVMQRRCVGCKKVLRAASVPGESPSVPGAPSDPQWRVDPGTTWNRYRGKGRRGRLTREEQAEEDKRDAKFAIVEVEKFIAAIDVVMSDDVQQLGRIQRDEAKRQAAAHLGSAGRFLDDLADRYGAEGQ